jgi:hypothetical protein
MKIYLSLVLSALTLLVHALPAAAAWGPFVSLGTNTVNSDVSCAPLTGGDAVCAARSFTNTILVNQFNGTALAGRVWLEPSRRHPAVPRMATAR